MALASDLQSRILLLYLDKKSSYAASKELNINYRTAKKYYEQLDQMIDEIKGTVVCCIFEEIRKNPQNFIENCMQLQETQGTTSDEDETD